MLYTKIEIRYREDGDTRQWDEIEPARATFISRIPALVHEVNACLRRCFVSGHFTEIMWNVEWLPNERYLLHQGTLPYTDAWVMEVTPI